MSLSILYSLFSAVFVSPSFCAAPKLRSLHFAHPVYVTRVLSFVLRLTLSYKPFPQQRHLSHCAGFNTYHLSPMNRSRIHSFLHPPSLEFGPEPLVFYRSCDSINSDFTVMRVCDNTHACTRARVCTHTHQRNLTLGLRHQTSSLTPCPHPL